MRRFQNLRFSCTSSSSYSSRLAATCEQQGRRRRTGLQVQELHRAAAMHDKFSGLANKVMGLLKCKRRGRSPQPHPAVHLGQLPSHQPVARNVALLHDQRMQSSEIGEYAKALCALSAQMTGLQSSILKQRAVSGMPCGGAGLAINALGRPAAAVKCDPLSPLTARVEALRRRVKMINCALGSSRPATGSAKLRGRLPAAVRAALRLAHKRRSRRRTSLAAWLAPATCLPPP